MNKTLVITILAGAAATFLGQWAYAKYIVASKA